MANNIKHFTVTVERKADDSAFTAYAFTAHKAEKIVREASTARAAAGAVVASLPAPAAPRFRFDTAAFLNFYASELSLSGLEAITGINQRQLSHYVTGHRHPSPQTAKRIESAVKEFAKELSKVTLK